MADNSFLGSGMKFPPQINNATGRFLVSEKETSVKESIYLILMTALGERFMRPDFGSNIMSYTFMDVNSATVGIMKRNLTRFITSQEPRISQVTIDVDNTTRPGALLVDIQYTISATNEKDNMVFPFYLNNDVAQENPDGEMDVSGSTDDVYEADGNESIDVSEEPGDEVVDGVE